MKVQGTFCACCREKAMTNSSRLFLKSNDVHFGILLVVRLQLLWSLSEQHTNGKFTEEYSVRHFFAAIHFRALRCSETSDLQQILFVASRSLLPWADLV